jgi:protein ImuA
LGPGLQLVGIDPARLVMVAPRNDQETLWAMEEALRSDGIALVVGEIELLDLTASRRLQLAAESHGRMAIALRRWRKGDTARQQQQAPLAAATRWLIRPLPGWRPAPAQGKRRPDLGAPCWRLDLWRQRNGPAGGWDILMQDRELRHVEHASRFAPTHGPQPGQALSGPLAATLGHRPLAPAANSQQDSLAAAG